uniref:Ribosomal protein S2 n=1 Tax=Ulva sp. TM637 TaxID=2496872 RepID=A0A7R6NFB3_9CHLO|nr:ribosomal protein S2 [Ulva sp. TM637]AZP40074.1 ribosomal protein S2 [Ulva sp. TM637]
MIYIINNNTTHNYSRYSIGPSHIYNSLLKVKYPIQKIIDSDMFENNQPYLFQTKQLLCWGPDLAFLNLRNTFSNIFKALQICWSAARNNKKIVFINGNDSIDADSILVNTWLMQQCKRHSMPCKLNNISNIVAKYINNLTVPSKYSASSLSSKALFNHLNTFFNSLKMKTTCVQDRKIQNFIKNPNALFNCTLTRPLLLFRQKPNNFDAHAPIERQINQSQKLTNSGSLQTKIKHRKLIKTPRLETQKASKVGNHSITIGKVLYNNENQYIVNHHNKLQIKMKNAIQLQVKEAQTLTQQIAGEITAPLVGFLTNTKTGFNTLQNQLNEEFYNHSKSVDFNNTSKSLLKSIVDIEALKPTKTKKAQSPAIQHNINNYRTFFLTNVIGKSNLKKRIYTQSYLPFSFYIRPVTRLDLLTSEQYKEQYKAKQSIVQQSLFGQILAWRLKGQHPSSIFYSQFKIFDQRNKYKSKQVTIPNQNNIEAFKVIGQSKLASSKPQVLFKNTKNFIKFKSPSINKASFHFYSNYKLYKINSKERSAVAFRDIHLKLKKNKHNLKNILAKKVSSNSIDHFYINRFYKSVEDGRAYSNQNKNSVRSNRSSVTGLFRNNQTFKAYKSFGISKQVIPKLFRCHEKKFRNYYDKLISSNQLNQYQMFAKSPFINNKLADIMFFINPEKNQNLVNQANCLKIPTIGVISGMATSQLGRHSCNRYSLNNLVNYPILGNPSSSFFIYSLIGVFIKTLRSS